MAKLQMSDLTPEILAEIEKMNDAKEVVAYFNAKGFELSEKGAALILEQIHADGAVLNEDALNKVAGGCGDSRPSGTRS